MDPLTEKGPLQEYGFYPVAAKFRRKIYRNVVFRIGLEASPDMQQGQ
jgi:hypothetical protein